ncbi:hypothetical protein PVT71_27925 (plasmid) [Salipiger sp. H15]|uniref:4,5-dihydroxyphthalate decarboxylase n=1 Tax=Alloyangia sp. H15 TaxID=3029062 RepID=A0AAU8ATV0_9RHOB
MSAAPLSITVGHHPISRAAMEPGRAERHGLELQRIVTRPMHDAFTPMIREQAFDASELAIVSAMQAVAYGVPLVLLPVTLAARFQHGCIVRNAERPAFGVGDMAGRRVGVRAYTQTTGAWVRTILQHEYGLSPLSMHWVTQVGAHVAQFEDPPHVEHAPKSASLLGMLEEGVIDAAIFGNDLPDLPWVAPVIEDADSAARASFARTGRVPVNHLLCVTRELAEARPEAVAGLMALFREAKAESRGAGEDLYPLGIEAMAASVEALLASAWDQGLLPERMDVGTLFGPARAILGSGAD